jgi:heme/copper-type cytochrome/quinol oxidase subunit 2
MDLSRAYGAAMPMKIDHRWHMVWRLMVLHISWTMLSVLTLFMGWFQWVLVKFQTNQDHHDGAVQAGFRRLGIKLICLLGWFGKPVFIG